jgi:hypothetical protein
VAAIEVLRDIYIHIPAWAKWTRKICGKTEDMDFFLFPLGDFSESFVG